MTCQWLRNAGLLWLRVFAGLGIAWHGYGKIFAGDMAGFSRMVAHLGFPAPDFFAWAAALSELVGGVCLVLGLATPLAGLMVVITMSVAAFLLHGADSFEVKELALCYWSMAGTLMLTGAGDWSLDAFFVGRVFGARRR